MELTKIKACICEGAAEAAIIDILLENNLLIFKREEMLDGGVIRCRDGKAFETRYLRKGFNEFKKSGKKPSIFCKENLKMSSVKSYDFVKKYFENPKVLLNAIKKYSEISRIRKGEYTLLDLVK